MSTDIQNQDDQETVEDSTYDFDDGNESGHPSPDDTPTLDLSPPTDSPADPQNATTPDETNQQYDQVDESHSAEPLFDDSHYGTAQQYGLSREAVDSIGNPVALGHVLQAMSATYNQYQHHLQQQYTQEPAKAPQNEQVQEASPTPFSFELNAEQFDPDLAKALDSGINRLQETMFNPVSQEVAELRQKIDQLNSIYEQQQASYQQQEAQRTQTQIDGFISNLGEELKPVFGKGSLEPWGTKQHSAYQQLLNDASAVQALHPNAPIEELLETAVKIRYSQQNVQQQESNRHSHRGTDGRYVPTPTARPTSRSTRDDRTNEEKASEYADAKLREMINHDDELGDGEF